MNLCGEELYTKPSRKSQLIRNLDDAVREVKLTTIVVATALISSLRILGA